MNPEEYVNMGWYIFPCHSIDRGRCTCRDGATCTSPGKHPRTARGVKDATNDIETVRMWAASYPETNWGLACGRLSGVVVVDIDPRHGGFDSFDEYEAQRTTGPLPPTLVAISGGGGRHHFFKFPADGQPLKNRVDWMPGVDIRSDGGYVILAPGSHISGGFYQWRNWGATIDPLPDDVATSIRDAGVTTQADREALADSSSILDGVPEGKRDDTLFRWACRLRRQHASDADGGRAVVTQLVLAAAAASNFPREQALIKVEQAYKQDHSDGDPWAGDVDDPTKRLTDMGNRDRLLEAVGDNLLYVNETGWYRWTDLGWVKTHEEDVLHRAEKVPKLIRKEANTFADARTVTRFMRFADSSESSGSLAAMVKLAKGHPDISRTVDDFDTVKTDLACVNGVVDLRTGRIRPFSREDMTTRNTGVTYDPDADMTWWTDFINASTEGDEDLAHYLQLAAGYTATGLNTQECFFIVSGPPASGKSTYVDGMMTALGSYASTSQSDTFMYRRGKDASPHELARMAGQRLVSVSEIREGDFFNEALIKQITGGDRISARHLYHNAFEYTPQFKLWIATNHDPMSYDSAMLRRIKRVKFPHSVPYEKRDHTLKLKAKDTDLGSPAVIRWIVEGAMMFLKEGKLEEPLSVTAAAHEYKAEQDIFGRFIKTTCAVEGTATCEFTALFTRWVMWCKDMNENAGRAFSFKRRLIDSGYGVSINNGGIEVVTGVRPHGVTATADGGMKWG